MSEAGECRIITYRSENADAGKHWLARAEHPRTGRLPIFFEGPSEAAVIEKAEAVWSADRDVREAAWSRRDSRSALRKAAAR